MFRVKVPLQNVNTHIKKNKRNVNDQFGRQFKYHSSNSQQKSISRSQIGNVKQIEYFFIHLQYISILLNRNKR